MTKQEIINSVKKIFIDLYGEDLSISESQDSIDWNFSGGLHMCSLIFIGNKYEAKLDSSSICGTCDSFQEQWFRDKATKASRRKPFEFLENLLGDSYPQGLWEQHSGEKFRLEYDGSKLGWAMSCSDGKKFIYNDGVCKELK